MEDMEDNKYLYRIILEASKVLLLPNSIAAISMLIIHKARKCVKPLKSLADMGLEVFETPQKLITVSLFLAAKAEECHRSIRDVLNAVNHVTSSSLTSVSVFTTLIARIMM